MHSQPGRREPIPEALGRDGGAWGPALPGDSAGTGSQAEQASGRVCFSVRVPGR